MYMKRCQCDDFPNLSCQQWQLECSRIPSGSQDLRRREAGQHAAIICLSTCCNHLYVNMLHYDIFLGDFLRQD